MTKEEKLHNTISALRAQKKISQQQLAESVGVSRQTINAIENYRYEPSCILAIKIAHYFGTTVEELFSIHTS